MKRERELELADALERLSTEIRAGRFHIRNYTLTLGTRQIKPISVDGELWAQYEHTGRDSLRVEVRYTRVPASITIEPEHDEPGPQRADGDELVQGTDAGVAPGS